MKLDIQVSKSGTDRPRIEWAWKVSICGKRQRRTPIAFGNGCGSAVAAFAAAGEAVAELGRGLAVINAGNDAWLLGLSDMLATPEKIEGLALLQDASVLDTVRGLGRKEKP